MTISSIPRPAPTVRKPQINRRWVSSRRLGLFGPGGKPTVWTRGLTIPSPVADRPLIADLTVALRSGAITTIADHSPIRAAALVDALIGVTSIDSQSLRGCHPANPTEEGFSRKISGNTSTPAITVVTPASHANPSLSIVHNVVAPLTASGWSASASTLSDVLRACGLNEVRSEFPHHVSLPLLDLRVSVAQGLLAGSRTVIFTDYEYSSAISSAQGSAQPISHSAATASLWGSDTFWRLARTVANLGVAVVIVTCRVSQVQQADRALIISDGTLHADIAYPDVKILTEHWPQDSDLIPTLGPIPTAATPSAASQQNPTTRPARFKPKPVTEGSQIQLETSTNSDVSNTSEESSDLSPSSEVIEAPTDSTVYERALPELEQHTKHSSTTPEPTASIPLISQSIPTTPDIPEAPETSTQTPMPQPAPQKNDAPLSEHTASTVTGSNVAFPEETTDTADESVQDTMMKLASHQPSTLGVDDEQLTVVQEAQRILSSLPGPVFQDTESQSSGTNE